jgi:hypothetical protein
MEAFVPLESLYSAEHMNEDDAPEEDPREEVQTNTTVKYEGHFGARKDFSLEEIKEKIQSLQKPPPTRDIAYFQDVCNLNNKGTNPHRLQEKKHVSKANLHEMFGLGQGRSSFRFTDYKNSKVRAFVEKLWSLCYGKAHMPQSKLIAKEFFLGVLAQFQQGMEMDWATFVAETNANQRSKYVAHLRRWENMWDQILSD